MGIMVEFYTFWLQCIPCVIDELKQACAELGQALPEVGPSFL